MNAVAEARTGSLWSRARLVDIWERVRYPLSVYLASRVLYVLIALAEALVAMLVGHPTSVSHELHQWDGYWYVQLAEHGYPHHVFDLPHQYTTLGFLPLFSALMWLLSTVTGLSSVGAGIALSLLFGASATLLVTRLAERWWGGARARRALWFWCFFPGTVVFSMVYTEGLTITLVAGALLLLQRRRWARAGLLAGCATAVAPVALAVIPACAVAALQHLRRRGWSDRGARRALIAPILSPLGIVAAGIFLWFWTGTPLASYRAQHGAWQESSSPLAVPRLFGSLIHQIFIKGVTPGHGPLGIDLNGILGMLGAVFLIYALWRLWKVRRTLPAAAWTWTLFASLLALTSDNTPPNPRLLICIFPLVLIVGAEHAGRVGRRVLIADIAWLIILTPITFIGTWLRP